MNKFSNLTGEEKELVYIGLSMRKNLLETGDTGLSLEDAARQNLKVRPMTADQMKGSLKHRELMDEIYK